ncbi:hypothetical protein [Lysinibacillus sp. SGAir0095]|uniref:hypothetical protein n=1 Tax=Lysinibacillus sp. SGAir0095 TaxID=2070463 RepID=UPI0010CCF4E9|nr:hypothetical protein [Lysinibacillus sp. SGAir0095]QCR33807.1 hypothetical protein C1N55_17435 [Lysinibacillus sp. SGAir0095]
MFQLFLLLLEVVYLFLAFKTGGTLYLIVAIGLGAWWLYELNKDVKKRSEALLTDTIQKVEQHPHTRYIISSDYLSVLMLDEYSNTLRILEREEIENDFDKKEFDFDELYEIAIVEDDNNVALTSKGGVHGWSLIDGGAKVDIHINEMEESSEKKEKTNEVKKLILKIVVDDLAEPIVEYVFLDNEQEIPKELDEYKDIFKECTKWYQKISVIIKRHEHERKIQEVAIKGWT